MWDNKVKKEKVWKVAQKKSRDVKAGSNDSNILPKRSPYQHRVLPFFFNWTRFDWNKLIERRFLFSSKIDFGFDERFSIGKMFFQTNVSISWIEIKLKFAYAQIVPWKGNITNYRTITKTRSIIDVLNATIKLKCMIFRDIFISYLNWQ